MQAAGLTLAAIGRDQRAADRKLRGSEIAIGILMLVLVVGGFAGIIAGAAWMQGWRP